jgi:hypothetical protein
MQAFERLFYTITYFGEKLGVNVLQEIEMFL